MSKTMTEVEMVMKYHCNTELHSGACDYAQYTEDDPMCQQCAIGSLADLRAYKLSSDHKFRTKYKNPVKEF